MKKYKCEIWKYHVKIDEFESDNPVLVNHWFNKNYKQADEWGECTHYFFTDGIDVEELREKQYKEMMDAKATNEQFTLDEKLLLLKIFIAHSTLSTEMINNEPQMRLQMDTLLNTFNVGELYLAKMTRYIIKEQIKYNGK